jgi:transposase-like protein
MTWIKIAKTPHDCPLPSAYEAYANGYTVGSQWQCDGCGQVWDLSYDWGSPFFMPTKDKVYVEATIKKEVLP